MILRALTPPLARRTGAVSFRLCNLLPVLRSGIVLHSDYGLYAVNGGFIHMRNKVKVSGQMAIRSLLKQVCVHCTKDALVKLLPPGHDTSFT